MYMIGRRHLVSEILWWTAHIIVFYFITILVCIRVNEYRYLKNGTVFKKLFISHKSFSQHDNILYNALLLMHIFLN